MMIRAWIFFGALLACCSGLVGCGAVTEKDMADLRSVNEILKKEAMMRISAKRPFPFSLWGQLMDQEGKKKAIAIMAELLTSGKESREITLAAIKALGKLSRTTEVPVDVLEGFLKADDSRMRFAAVEALGKAKSKNTAPLLLELLRKEKEPYPIVWALGEIGTDEAVPHLNRLLASDEKYLRFNAYKALVKIGKNQADFNGTSVEKPVNSDSMGWLKSAFTQYQSVMAALMNKMASPKD